MQIVVLAGGLATRLGELTRETPKSLVAVSGRPFVEFQMELFQRNKITEVVMCIGHLGAKIRDVVGDGHRWGLKVRWVDEGIHLRGTGGALRGALDLGQLSEKFLLIYGDSYLSVDFQQVMADFQRRPAEVMMTVLKNRGSWDRSNASVKGDKVLHYSKVAKTEFEFIDYGLSALSADVVAEIPRDTKFDLADFYEKLSLEGRLDAFCVDERFYEVGSPSGLVAFSEFVEAGSHGQQ